MNELIILGAGASVAYDVPGRDEPAGIPATQNLLSFAARKGTLDENEHQSLVGCLDQHLGVSFTDLKSNNLDVEQVYSKLETLAGEPPATLDDIKAFTEYRQKDRPREQLLEVIQHTIAREMYSYNTSTTHKALARRCASSDWNAISFNWDTLFEDALAGASAWQYQTGYGVEFDEVRTDHGAAATRTRASSDGRVLKPHGSINWYRYKLRSFQSAPFTGETVSGRELMGTNLAVFTSPYRRSMNQIDLGLELGTEFKPPLRGPIEMDIVAPGVQKRKERPAFEAIWDQMSEVVRSADRIVIIGFAMKDSDSESIEVFKQARQGLRRSVRIQIVNPSVNECYVERCRATFAPCTFDPHCGTLREYVSH